MAGENHVHEELMDAYLTPNYTRQQSSIVRPPIAANNFDLKPSLISLVEKSQFAGEDHEDPHDFLDRFLRIYDTTKHNGVSKDAIRLRLFPFAVKGEALRWVEREPPNSIANWDDLAAKFLAQFFPMTKYNRLVNEITNFTQYEGETLCAAWRRFKELMRRCPQYEMQAGQKVRIFFNWMNPEFRMILKGAAGGSIRQKTPTQTLELIESMARMENESTSSQPKRGVLHLDSSDALLAEQKSITQQLAILNAKIERMQVSPAQVKVVSCEYCQGEHETNECNILLAPEPIQVNGVWYDQRPQQNYQRNNNAVGSSNYNPKWKNQGGGLDYKSNQYLQPPPIPPKEPSELEKALLQLTNNTNAFMEETRSHHKNQDASLRNLENQIGQLSRQLAERTQGQFPSDTITNPREHCKAITTRMGTVIEPKEKPKKAPKDALVGEEEAEKEKAPNEESNKPARSEEANNKAEEKQKKQVDISHYAEAPYPMRLKQQAQKQQYARFLDIFKKLQVNIPFVEALANMPNYAKFMKNLLSRKHKL